MTPETFLAATATTLRELIAKLGHLERRTVEDDIKARRVDANIGLQWAKDRDRIATALEATGQRMDHWLEAIPGCDIHKMRRRLRLAKRWSNYVATRRKLGECGYSGLDFAVSLIRQRTNSRRSSIRSSTGTNPMPDRVQLITGDALKVLPTLPRKSVQCVITSPPYWPTKRAYGGIGLGFEKTLQEYIDALVLIFREAREVLKDDGLMFIQIDDSYSKAGGFNGHDPKSPAISGLSRQGTTSIRPLGNLLLIPTRFAMAMQDDGWVLRQRMIIKKVKMKPDSGSKTRPSKNYEELFMFSKRARGYTYDPDPIKNPLAASSMQPVRRKVPTWKPVNQGSRLGFDPVGSNPGSVWEIESDGYQGHPAVMPMETVRRCILIACPDEDSLVLDCCGGAATTALVALELGHRAISIDIADKYTREARERLAAYFQG